MREWPLQPLPPQRNCEKIVQESSRRATITLTGISGADSNCPTCVQLRERAYVTLNRAPWPAMRSQTALLSKVHPEGVEPPIPKALGSKPSVYASSTTGA